MKLRPFHLFSILMIAGLFLFVSENYKFSPTGMVVAEISNAEQALGNLDTSRDLYNNNIERVPSFVKTIFGNERLNVTVTRDNGNLDHVSIETENGLITTITRGSFDAYTMDMRVSEKTINDIAGSNDQASQLKQALDNGEITYTPRTVASTVKTGMAKIFLTIMSWFS
jgi:hypothetical protein